MNRFYSPGKLLLTGEYVVLDGATSFAVPTKFGQGLDVEKIEERVINWTSLDHNGEIWFQDTYKIADILSGVPSGNTVEDEVSKMLFLTLHTAARMNPEFFQKENGFKITTKCNFPRNWGLGTSSTLIANLSKWCGVDAFKLLNATFGGSGYDVAVAMHESALTFEKRGAENVIFKTSFDPGFKDLLFFVHLNQKQNSRDSIRHYKNQEKKTLNTGVEKISNLTHSMLSCHNISEFNLLIELHENIISQLLGLKKVKARLFPDYPGAVKSLGGWGGDFVLATGNLNDQEYFRKKGYATIIPYSDMLM